MLISIFSHTKKSYADAVFAGLSKGKRHAGLLYAEWMRKGDLSDLKVEPQAENLIAEIIAITDFSLPQVGGGMQEEGTHKMICTLSDGLQVEAVAIPMQSGTTLCISSQVGCMKACAFCETGRMGLLRSLSASEIVGQVFLARQRKIAIKSIVFMGMGEPLDNYEEVVAAIRVLLDPGGMNFAPSKITISTSGVVDRMEQLAKEFASPINLAVSVNAPDDEVRRRIMPINRKWNMQRLREAMDAYCKSTAGEILAEYVLLEGINDSPEQAVKLAEYLGGLPVKINVIPYNPQSNDRFAPPSQEVIEAFAQVLRSAGFMTFLRRTKGRQIMAGCGQLGNLSHKKRLLHSI